MSPRIHTKHVVATLCLIAVAIIQPVSAEEKSESVIEVAPQSLATALQEFSDQSGLQIAYVATLADNKTSPGTDGAATPTAALDDLLDGTDLQHQFVNEETVAIGPATTLGIDEDQELGKSQPASSLVLMAQNQTSAREDQTSNRSETINEEDRDVIPLEEIIVVGSNIRGVDSASPVLEFSREEILNSGFTSTEQFLRHLPQNFGGGLSGNIAPNTGTERETNFDGSEGVNLRGLGNTGTLVLVNGKRFATSGNGATVDVSMIPIGAIDRIEIMTDGASAIYGSDAIGGVVNFILQKDFEGAETRIRYGTVTDGDHDDIQFGQSLGTSWGEGNLVFGYNYRKRNPLKAVDRSFVDTSGLSTVGGVVPSELFGEKTQHSAMLSVNQNLSDSVRLNFDALFGQREKVDNVTTTTGPFISEGTSTQYNIASGVEFDIGNTWQGNVDVLFSDNESDSPKISNGVLINTINTSSDVLSFDLKFDGTVATIPGGQIRAALGGQMRNESISFLDDTSSSDGTPNRNLSAIFGEVFFPLFGESNAKSGLKRLELTMAVRSEDYSDFGRTTNPKYGLLWSPGFGLKFRGTYGTSFRAPLLIELDTVFFPLTAWVFSVPDVMSTFPSGNSIVMYVSGYNSNLGPEESETTTVGFDYQPEFLKGLNLSATYYDIEYENRIAFPVSFLDFFFGTVFNNEAVFQDFIARNPSLAEVTETVDSLSQLVNVGGPGFTPAPLDEIAVIVNGQLNNSFITRQTGLDFSISYNFGQFTFTSVGTRLFDNVRKLTPTAPEIDELNTAFKPVELKLRSGLVWNGDALSVGVAHNYVSSYRDVRTASAGKIPSWETVDLNIRYASNDKSTWMDGTTFSINIQNLFDEDPPFVTNANGFNFDGANANAVGRFVSIGFAKSW